MHPIVLERWENTSTIVQINTILTQRTCINERWVGNCQAQRLLWKRPHFATALGESSHKSRPRRRNALVAAATTPSQFPFWAVAVAGKSQINLRLRNQSQGQCQTQTRSLELISSAGSRHLQPRSSLSIIERNEKCRF